MVIMPNSWRVIGRNENSGQEKSRVWALLGVHQNIPLDLPELLSDTNYVIGVHEEGTQQSGHQFVNIGKVLSLIMKGYSGIYFNSL